MAADADALDAAAAGHSQPVVGYAGHFASLLCMGTIPLEPSERSFEFDSEHVGSWGG